MAQTTKKRIMEGFLELLEQRPLDKISVVDIADHCGINRNTFYYYYCDVYALIRELMEVRAQQLITNNQKDLNWIEITREVTSFFRTHRRTVYHLFHSSQRDLLEDHIYDVTYACTESLVRRTARPFGVGGGPAGGDAVFHQFPAGHDLPLAALRHEGRCRAAGRAHRRPAGGHAAPHAGAQLRDGEGDMSGFLRCALYLLTLALLTAIILRCLYVARHAKTRLEGYACIGVASVIIFQVIINVGMCLFVMPVIGLTLPFISYGGSSLVMLFACMGLVSGVHGRAKPDWLR